MARIKIGEGFGKGCTKAARKSAPCRQSYSEDSESVSEEENGNGKSPPKSPRRCVATKAARKYSPVRQSYSEDSELVSEEETRYEKAPRKQLATKAGRKSANGLSTAPNAVGGHDTKRQAESSGRGSASFVGQQRGLGTGCCAISSGLELLRCGN